MLLTVTKSLVQDFYLQNRTNTSICLWAMLALPVEEMVSDTINSFQLLCKKQQTNKAWHISFRLEKSRDLLRIYTELQNQIQMWCDVFGLKVKPREVSYFCDNCPLVVETRITLIRDNWLNEQFLLLLLLTPYSK